MALVSILYNSVYCNLLTKAVVSRVYYAIIIRRCRFLFKGTELLFDATSKNICECVFRRRHANMSGNMARQIEIPAERIGSRCMLAPRNGKVAVASDHCIKAAASSIGNGCIVGRFKIKQRTGDVIFPSLPMLILWIFLILILLLKSSQ